VHNNAKMYLYHKPEIQSFLIKFSSINKLILVDTCKAEKSAGYTCLDILISIFSWDRIIFGNVQL